MNHPNTVIVSLFQKDLTQKYWLVVNTAAMLTSTENAYALLLTAFITVIEQVLVYCLKHYKLLVAESGSLYHKLFF